MCTFYFLESSISRPNIHSCPLLLVVEACLFSVSSVLALHDGIKFVLEVYQFGSDLLMHTYV